MSNSADKSRTISKTRIIDLVASSVLLLLLWPLMLATALAVRISSPGPILHRSKRFGVNRSNFEMFKFRTMRVDAPQVATHLMTNADDYLTPVGRFLRKSSLDELPQLVNVFRGEMALVGPRPALYNQHDLIAMRETRGINELRPGITGLAQVSGRDLLTLEDKVAIETEYRNSRSLLFDLKILLRTVFGVPRGAGVSSDAHTGKTHL